MVDTVVNAALGNINNLVVEETRFLCAVTNQAALLKLELERLKDCLKDAESKRRSGKPGVATLLSQIKDATYEGENAIEAAEYVKRRNRIKKGFMGAISRYARIPSDLTTLHKVGAKIMQVKTTLIEIFDSAQRLQIDFNRDVVDESLEDYVLMHQNFEDDLVMVGFEDEFKEIVDKLVHTENMLSVVSIVAMGGAGKTTLARKVYASFGDKQHFEALVWVTVSQKFKVIDLLKEIVKQISSDGDQSINNMDEKDVGKKIHDILMQKRYLLVLDDVWEMDTWEQINRTKAFPDAANGSRVLLTTRKHDVANHVEMPTHVHALRCLDEEKSWELLSSKALPSYIKSGIRDLDEYEKLGRKLARKCDGLPLALKVLGSYLLKNPNKQAWHSVLSDWPSGKGTEKMRGIIARSYKDLPNHYLRSCFLYLVAFPEDFIISVSDLIKLWIAESFIEYSRKHTLEEMAHMYVTELAQRSLVQVVKTSNIHGWIEEIRIHDILREWCIDEAAQDGFLVTSKTNEGQVGASSSDMLKSYRSSFQKSGEWISKAPPNIRALFGFGVSSISLSFPELRFLRVLYVENSRIENFSEVIGGCIHLRYLSLRGLVVKFPSSIGKLLYLQTIDLPLASMYISEVSSSLWDIPTLRYVNIQTCIPLPRRWQIPQNLRELHMMAAGHDTKRDPMPILEMLPYLAVLTLHGYDPETMSFGSEGFRRLQKLTLTGSHITKWRMKVGTMRELLYLSFEWPNKKDDIPNGLLHLPSLRFVLVWRTRKDYSNDTTVVGLKQKGCEVKLFG